MRFMTKRMTYYRTDDNKSELGYTVKPPCMHDHLFVSDHCSKYYGFCNLIKYYGLNIKDY